MKFEMLLLDPGKQTQYVDTLSLLFGIRSLSKLWVNATLNEKELTITDGNTVLYLIDQNKKIVDDVSPQIRRGAFLISLCGDFDKIEQLRLPIIEFVKEQKFKHRYITKDEISEKIACELYPYLYRVENRLRGYLTHFMTTRYGGTWWELTASKEMDQKAKMRKKNEVTFGSHIDNSAFLIDFDEIGKLIFGQTSGLLTREDIATRVMETKEDIESLRKLKSELQLNYHKFFKTAFADRDFKPKWEEWYLLRNKIAHCNLFTKDDLIKGQKIADELIEMISEADKSPEQPSISQVEREAVQEQIIARTIETDPLSTNISNELVGLLNQNSLTEVVFLKELSNQEAVYSKQPNGFVGLVRFLRYHLTELGYEESVSSDMLNSLKNQNKIEIYYVDNIYGHSKPTAALRHVPVATRNHKPSNTKTSQN
jgi:Apea-like HEPN